MAKSGIYEIVNSINGKRYIGSSADIDARWSGHKHRLRRGDHHSAALQRAWHKYGEAAFSIRVRLLCARECLIAAEQAAMDADGPEYNVALFAGRTILPAESIERRSKKRRGRKTGPLSPTHRSAISEGNKGKRLSTAHIEAIRTAKSGRARPDMIGNKWGRYVRSAELCRQMSEAQKGKPKSEETKARMRAAWVKRKQSLPA